MQSTWKKAEAKKIPTGNVRRQARLSLREPLYVHTTRNGEIDQDIFIIPKLWKE